MQLAELRADQRRQLIDAQQAFHAWRTADREFRHSYRGEMHWRKVSGREYLARKYHKVWEQLGRRSPETEKIKADYTEQRSTLRARLTRLGKRLDEMAPLNKAMGLGRVPTIAARVLRKLDERGLLGTHVFVAGTHALYAYEARSGILFSGELTATTDIDLLWDARQRFTFLMQDINQRGVIGLLQQVDATFKRTATYRAENADPYLVEVIRPLRKNEMMKPELKMSRAEGDFEPASIEGLQWLLNAPKFEEVAIGEDGKPLLVSCVDPRAFALHKLWLSKRDSREGLKRRRDELQARAVAAVATQYMGLKFERRELTSLPKELAEGIVEFSKTRLETRS
jgi:hypothetical protein